MRMLRRSFDATRSFLIDDDQLPSPRERERERRRGGGSDRRTRVYSPERERGGGGGRYREREVGASSSFNIWQSETLILLNANLFENFSSPSVIRPLCYDI